MGGAGESRPARPRTASGWDRGGYDGFSAYMRAIAGQARGARLIEREGLLALVCPAAPDRSLFNSVLYEHPAALEAAYLDLAAAYSGAGVRAWTVWVPEGDRDSLALLESRGHAYDGTPRMMAAELAELDPPAPAFEVDRSCDWSTCCGLNDAAYGYEEGTYLAGMGPAPDAGFTVLGAAWEGKPASTLGTLEVDGELAVFLVATRPDARGRGLASGLLAAALRDARERGLRASNLQASPSGAPIYERLGYRDLGGVTLQEHRTPR